MEINSVGSQISRMTCNLNLSSEICTLNVRHVLTDRHILSQEVPGARVPTLAGAHTQREG